MLTAIDIHPAYQPGFPIETAPVDCIITKVTEGTDVIRGAATYVDRTLACGKLAGVYHFLDQTDDAAEARFFAEQIAGWIGRVVLCVDWEQYGVSTADGLWTFSATVHDLTGAWPLIYTNYADERAIRPGPAKASLQRHCGLWLAAPGLSWVKTDWPIAGFPAPPSGWLLALWQAGWLPQEAARIHFGWDANRVDIDWFFGDRSAWEAYAQGDGTPGSTNHAIPAAAAECSHIVAAGDTLSILAERFGTTTDRLVALNHIANPDLIRVGQVLQIG